jgi:hypothetical protein
MFVDQQPANDTMKLLARSQKNLRLPRNHKHEQNADTNKTTDICLYPLIIPLTTPMCEDQYNRISFAW